MTPVVTEAPASRIMLPERLRWIAVRGLAATVTGTVVLGLGGRLAMFGSRLLHPEAAGRLTENGNRIGEFTVSGTVELLVFAGLPSGVFAGVIWVLMKAWLPDRVVVVGVSATALGGFNLVNSSNSDFFILRSVGLDVVMLIGVIAAFGFVLLPVDRWLDQRLPPAGSTSLRFGYLLIAALGAPLTFPAIASFLSRDFCFCAHPPVWSGIGLILASLATIGLWIWQWRADAQPPNWLIRFGQASAILAVVAGAIYLGVDINRIL